MTQAVVSVAGELEELRKLKARYRRFLDTNDVQSWRGVFAERPESSAHFVPTGRQMHGAGRYHETYEKSDGSWRITSLHLTRTILRITGGEDA